MKTALLSICLVILSACNTAPEPNESSTSSGTIPEAAADTPALPSTPPSYARYCNARYGYCVEYPGLLTPEPEAQNGDGRVFTNARGEVVLTVFGRTTALPGGGTLSLEDQYETDVGDYAGRAEPHSITYRKMGKNFFVISGRAGDKIFYQKTALRRDAFGEQAFYQLDNENKYGSTFPSAHIRQHARGLGPLLRRSH